MPYSKQQQIVARIALACKKETDQKKKAQMHAKLKGASLQMYNSMSMSELEDFAKGPIKK